MYETTNSASSNNASWRETSKSHDPLHVAEEASPLLLPSKKMQTHKRHANTNSEVADATVHTSLNDSFSSRSSSQPANILFGRRSTLSRHLPWNNASDNNNNNNDKKESMFSYLFGFMCEEDLDDHPPSQAAVPLWNNLNRAIFASYSLTTAAATVPVAFVPTMANDLNFDGTSFASKAAASAVLGTSFGKFLNGPVGDCLGARRVSIVYILLTTVSLMSLSWSHSSNGALWSLSFVNFFRSVHWPCIVVTLASHYKDKERYEAGIYVSSLASRFGALASIPLSSFLLKHSQNWRFVARCGALASLFSCFVTYCFISDSPGKRHEPQNPIRVTPVSITSVFHSGPSGNRGPPPIFLRLSQWISTAHLALETNIFPSVRSVVKSVPFWMVSMAHSGVIMVLSSQHVLGTYYQDTSGGSMSQNEASGLSVFLSLGTLVGLAFWGSLFQRQSPKRRKALVGRLYLLSVVMCYLNATWAIPLVRSIFGAPGLILMLQIITTFCMGAGIAVQSLIPGIVGAGYGASKGLYTSYTDGVACGVSSLVWRIVGGAVQEGHPQGGGWAYGWAAVALLLILSGVAMVEFIEYYFCRGKWQNQSKIMHSTSSFREQQMELEDPESSKVYRSPFQFPRNEDEKFGGPGTTPADAFAREYSIKKNYPQAGQTAEKSERKEEVMALAERQENQICLDCPNPYPRWLSVLVPFENGFFSRPIAGLCCQACVASHRRLGTHILFVRSIDHDELKDKELQALRVGGNSKINAIYEEGMQDKTIRPGTGIESWEREKFITFKYEKRSWVNHERSTKANVLENGDEDLLSMYDEAEPSGTKTIELVHSPKPTSKKKEDQEDLPSDNGLLVGQSSNVDMNFLAKDHLAVSPASSFGDSFAPVEEPGFPNTNRSSDEKRSRVHNVSVVARQNITNTFDPIPIQETTGPNEKKSWDPYASDTFLL